MKKTFYLLLLALIIFAEGCTMPGPYMSMSDIAYSARHRTQLPKTTIIPLSNPNNYASFSKYFEIPYEYRVGLYDVLGITVLSHPELSVSFNANQMQLVDPGQTGNQYLSASQQISGAQDLGYYVDTQGDIIFPLIGNVHVAGLTPLQIRQKLSILLYKYIRSPIVNVKVLTFNSQRVHVLGEVMQPGIRPLGDRALTILDAISLAGGINSQTADMRHIFILRRQSQDKILAYWLDAKTPSALLLAEHFRLLDNDIVYIPPAGITDVNRFINQFLPPIQAIWFTRSLVRN